MRSFGMAACVCVLVGHLFIAFVETSIASDPPDDKSIIITRVKGTTIICNKGKKYGIVAGMLFNLVRNGHIYGKAEVLVVKEAVSGLKVRELESGFKPRLNDKLKPYQPVEKVRKKSVQNGAPKAWWQGVSIEPYFLGSAGLIISETDIGVSFILGFQASFRRFWLTINPADLGGIPEENQDPRYRKETFSNGRTVCRDLSNGQFANSEKCAGTFRTIYAFSLDATYNVYNSRYPVYLGAGYRFGNNSGAYLAAAVGYALQHSKVNAFFKTHIGASLLVLSAGLLIGI